MKRVLLNLRPEDISFADTTAARLGVSRSEVVRRALGRMAEGPVEPDDREARIRQVRAALDKMRRFGETLGPDWDPVAIIRADRDSR